MNHKENFKDKFLELMSQQVTLDDTKDHRDELASSEEEDTSVSDGDIQELLKQKLKEKLKEKSTAQEINDEPGTLAELKHEIPLSREMEPEEMIYLEPALEELSVIMKDTFITGTIKTRGHLEIFGEMQGDISAAGDIKVLGNVRGNLSAEQLMIDGSVVGDLRATKKIQLLQNANVKGTLVTADFVVSQGAKLSGMVKAGEQEAR